MSELKYCMVCLSTDVKFCIKDYSFSDIYSALTQLKVNNLNQHLCFQCAGLLKKYHQFKMKCIRTDEVLSQTIVKPELTKFHLQTLQNKFNLASNLVISNVITEDIAGSVLPEFDVPKIVHADKNIDFDESDEENDSNMFIFPRNYEEKPSMYLQPKLEVFTHNVVDTDKNTTSDQKPRTIEILIKPDNDNVICEQDSGGIISSNTSGLQKKNINKKQINVLKSEPIHVSSDDESYHSDSSWTKIFNTLNRLKSENKKVTFNTQDESGTAKNMLQLEIEYLSDNNKNINKIKAEKIMAEKTSKTTRKQSKRKLNIPASKIASNAKRGRPKKAKTQCDTDKQSKLKGSTKSMNKGVIETLKKHGTVEVLTQEQARDEVLAMANYNSDTLPFKCNICYKGFRTKNTLDNHMYHHSPKRGAYECDNCHLRFPNKKNIHDHVPMFHGYKFTCKRDGCSFTCNAMHRGLTHINFHAGKTYNCKFCDTKFTARHSIFAHMYKKHPDEFKTEFVCELCGRIFYSAAGLKAHKLQPHVHEKNEYQGPECKECNVHFASEQAWNLHLVLSRKHEVANGCSFCGECFDNESDLKTHMKQHKDKITLTNPSHSKAEIKQQSFDCQHCNVVFNTEYYFKRHLHLVHGEPKPVAASSRKKRHICEICGDKFHARTLLTFHQYLHTGERPYKCQYCGRGFRNVAGQREHENTHTRAQIFKCHVCDKEFLRLASREKHLRQCMGKTFHKCVECGRSFLNNSSLKSHVRHKHEKVPYPQRKNPRYRRPKHSETVAEENIDTSAVNLF